MTKNQHYEAIQSVFRQRVSGWDSVPIGDPLRILTEAVAATLEETEIRYQELLSRVIERIPRVLGFEPRWARAPVVSLALDPSSKLSSPMDLASGTVLTFKSREQKYAVKLSSSCRLSPHVSTLTEGSLVEVLSEQILGRLEGRPWETLPLPHGLVDCPKEVVLRFPDDTSVELKHYDGSQLLNQFDLSAFKGVYFADLNSLTVPASDELTQGFGVPIQVCTSGLSVSVDADRLNFSEVQYSGEKTVLADAHLKAVLSPPLPAETLQDFQKRFLHCFQYASHTFHTSDASYQHEGERFLQQCFQQKLERGM